jgi:Ca2+-binding RTX toxin-like protein
LITLAKNGRLEFQGAFGTNFERVDGYALSGQGFATHETDGADFIYATGQASGPGQSWRYSVTVLDVGDPDTPRVVQQFGDTEAVGEASINGGLDPLIVSSGGRDYVLLTSAHSDQFHSYKIRGDGTLGKVKVSQAVENLSDGFASATIDGTTYIVTFGAWDTAPMQVLRLTKKGFLRPVAELSENEPAIYNRITKGIATAEAAGETYVFASEVTRGTIMSYRLEPGGKLTLVDQIDPGIGDSWSSPEELKSFTHDGETYVLSGGYGRSIAVFKVSDGGSLIEVDEFVMASPNLGRVADIEVVQFAEDQTYFALSTLAGAPLTSYRFLATDEVITGGGGNNTIRGTEADDQINARRGNDKVFGGLGDDLIEGGKGNDRLKGQDGADDLYGKEGSDTILGGSGADFIFGGADDDRLSGNDGNDYVVGDDGKDRIKGNEGNDRLFGGAGRDRLNGGKGNDHLSDGGGSQDRLTGGAGADVFIMANDSNKDIITDFENGLDLIDMRAEGEIFFTDLEITETGDDLIVRYGKDSILVEGANGKLYSHDLPDSDFIFL